MLTKIDLKIVDDVIKSYNLTSEQVREFFKRLEDETDYNISSYKLQMISEDIAYKVAN